MTITVLPDFTYPRQGSRGWFAGFDPSGRIVIHGATFTPGASPVQDPAHTNAERYDPSAVAWTTLAASAQYQQGNVAYTMDGSGRLYFAGGQVIFPGGTSSSSTPRGELYDPTSDTWSALPAMPNMVEWSTLVEQNRGSFAWVAGGTSGELWFIGGGIATQADQDITLHSATPFPGNTSFYDHTNTIVYSGGAAGSWSQVSQHVPGATIEGYPLFNDNEVAWTIVDGTPGTIYLLNPDYAGFTGLGPWKFDTATNTYTAIAASTFFSVGVHCIDKTSGIIYALRSSGPAGLFARYVIATDTWSNLANAPAGNPDRPGMAMFGGKLYVFGAGPSSSAIWEYDPGSNTWTVLSDTLSVARSRLITLPDAGGVYIIGGESPTGPVTTAFEYWTPTMIVPLRPRAFVAIIG